MELASGRGSRDCLIQKLVENDDTLRTMLQASDCNVRLLVSSQTNAHVVYVLVQTNTISIPSPCNASDART